VRGKLALTQAFKVLVIRENTDVEAVGNLLQQLGCAVLVGSVGISAALARR